mgnify:CR=1 FL=1
MITGANSGLGKFCAADFAKRGATVHMVCRNKERAEAAKQEIQQQAEDAVRFLFFPLFLGLVRVSQPPFAPYTRVTPVYSLHSHLLTSLPCALQTIVVHVVDMADTAAVAAFAREFVASGHALDVLINNAGCMLHERTTTDAGVETNFAVNTLGLFIK